MLFNGLVGTAISKHKLLCLNRALTFGSNGCEIAVNPHSVGKYGRICTLRSKQGEQPVALWFACESMGLAHTGCK